MKKFTLLVCGLAAAVIIFFCAEMLAPKSEEPENPYKKEESTAPKEAEKEMTEPEKKGRVRAIWISQYDLSPILTENGAQRKKDDFCKKAARMLDNCVLLGFDTVMLQTRPNGDSLYPSELFCPSAYAVGAYGKDFSYDPIEILVALCRERGLSVHAWINPLRLTRELEMREGFAVEKWWSDPYKKGRYVVLHEGRLYFNPAYAEVRRLIADGAVEVLARYSLDGVHMDDYFYPHGIGEGFDTEAYKSFGSGRTLAEFRRNNISSLVSEIYSAVKAVNENALFGISPSGNLETVYSTDYADVYGWCAKKGYIDYICPQIYFGMEHETWDFAKTLEKWEAVVSSDSVKLFVGITFGKAQNGSLGIEDKYAGSGCREWINSRRVLADCLEFAKERAELDGVFVFCYQYFYDPVSGEENENISEELENFLPVWKDF